MLGSGWFAMLKVLAAILCVFGILSFALIYFIPAPPSTITIASGFAGGNYERILDAHFLRDALASAKSPCSFWRELDRYTRHV
jgi:hypothetical protein